MDYKLLAEKAIEAKSNAYPKYSNFHVGAALLTENEDIILGCNVENSTYGLSMCAERTAIFKAYSDGIRKFKAIAIAGDSKDFCMPCGACRQIISDLCGNIDIVLINQKKEIGVFKLSELLPYAFGDSNLNG